MGGGVVVVMVEVVTISMVVRFMRMVVVLVMLVRVVVVTISMVVRVSVDPCKCCVVT